MFLFLPTCKNHATAILRGKGTPDGKTSQIQKTGTTKSPPKHKPRVVSNGRARRKLSYPVQVLDFANISGASADEGKGAR